MASVLLYTRILIIWNLLACVDSGEFVQPSTSTITTVVEGEAHLPCQFQVVDDEVVVQVSWTRNQDGTKVRIITAHHQEGQSTESNAYAGRVRFENSDPMANSALIIKNADLSDEGRYTCIITTFPHGTKETHVFLNLWSTPIMTLDPVTLVEGQSFRVAATCRAAAKPQAGLSWDTDLPGQSQNRSLENGIVSIQFSLHPLRSMNGRKLDCLVWHPTLKTPRRISNQLVVHYPPEVAISGYDENWYVGLEGATLHCDVGGNPKAQKFTWMRKGEDLPEGVTIEKEFLRFDRPLSLTDKGVYECVATNLVGSGNAGLEIIVAKNPTTFDKLLLIILGAVATVVVLILVTVVITVNHHHKRKNKELAMELHEKKEEISTLSRQASIRRVGSVSIDSKYQTDESIPLRVEGTTRNSFSSLDCPRSRDSHSTLGGLDTLGRPAIYNTSRRGRERTADREKNGERVPSRQKVENYNRSGKVLLVPSEIHFHPPLHPSPYPVEHTAEIIRSRNGSAIIPADGRPQSGGGSITGSRAGSKGHQSSLSSTYPLFTDEEESDMRVGEDLELLTGPIETNGLDNGDSETTSSQISEAMFNHFEHTNGTLWPKSTPNSIILAPDTTRLHHAHTNIIHHQPQIV